MEVTQQLHQKIIRVKEILTGLNRVAVAFSGGKDSYFLLKLATECVGEKNVVALHVKNLFSTQNDIKRVKYFRSLLNIRYKEIEVDVAADKNIMQNPRDRCYACKKKIFSTLTDEAKSMGISILLDGSIYSDLNEYRPGFKALKELKVISPLLEAKITSNEIIDYLRADGVGAYFLTSSTCLATRFPYDMELDLKLVRSFDELESLMVDLGVFPIKVRYIPEGVRLETLAEKFNLVLEHRQQIYEFCHQRGLKFICLDIEGLKSGAWD